MESRSKKDTFPISVRSGFIRFPYQRDHSGYKEIIPLVSGIIALLNGTIPLIIILFFPLRKEQASHPPTPASLPACTQRLRCSLNRRTSFQILSWHFGRSKPQYTQPATAQLQRRSNMSRTYESFTRGPKRNGRCALHVTSS